MKLSQILTMAAIALTILTGSSLAGGNGATQISGIAFLDFDDECDSGSVGADYAILMEEGDLIGCHYAWVDGWECLPNGIYREWGTELFVGYYDRDGDYEYGTFATTYLFTAKYEDCTTLEVEIFGRCQHPITAGSGTGVFEDVSGRIDFKDDVETGELFMRGHLRW